KYGLLNLFDSSLHVIIRLCTMNKLTCRTGLSVKISWPLMRSLLLKKLLSTAELKAEAYRLILSEDIFWSMVLEQTKIVITAYNPSASVNCTDVSGTQGF
ncbi:MAG: hypothetical protein RL161_173, partial [Bacteroidota bacterium]